MRVALIADIHGNLIALDTVLAEIDREEIDALICLGDVAVLGPQPVAVIQRLRARRCPVVMGNTDAWLLDLAAAARAEEISPQTHAITRWCIDQLTDADREYVRTFVPTLELPLDDETRLVCYHGSPRSYLDVIAATTPPAALDAMLAGATATVLAGGHTHTQMVRRYGDAHLINTGSVGLPGVNADSPALPRNRNARWGEYAIVAMEEGRLQIALRRTPLDVAAMRQAAQRSGMPHVDWWESRWERP